MEAKRIVHVVTSSIGPAQNRMYCKNSYYWLDIKLRAYLTRSFNLLPHMSMYIGLLKNEKCKKKNFHVGYPLTLSLPKECNFTHFSTVRYSDPVGTRTSSCRQPLTVGIGSQNNGLWSVSSQMFDHREELPLIFL